MFRAGIPDITTFAEVFTLMPTNDSEREIGQCAACGREIDTDEVYVELDQRRNGEVIGSIAIHNACLLFSLEDNLYDLHD